MSDNREKQGYYHFLDGWKGIFILWILTGHAAFLLINDWTGANRLFRLFFFFLPFAVDFFLIIAGFFAADVVLMKNRVGLAFLFGRARRILPQYLALVLAVWLLSYIVPPFYFRVDHLVHESMVKGKIYWMQGKLFYSFYQAYMPYLMFYQNYVKGVPLLDHTWFVAVLVHFYLFFSVVSAVAFRFLKRFDIWKIFLFVVLFLFVALEIIVSYTAAHGNNGDLTHLRLNPVLWGCLLRIGERHYPKTDDNVFWTFIFPSLLFLGGIGIIIYVMSICYFAGLTLPSNTFMLSYLAFGLMITGSYKNPLIRRILFENAVLRWLGRRSYGIYLWHYPIFIYFIYVTNINGIQVNPYFAFMLCAVCSIVLGSGMERIFDVRRKFREGTPNLYE